MGIPSLFAVHPTTAAAKPQTGRTDTEDADAAGLWASIAEATAGDPSTAGAPPTTLTPTTGAAREEPGAAEPGAAMADRAAPFDLPAFLQVLPKAGTAVAVAAGREPVMAAALRRLPARDAAAGAAVSSRPVSAQEGVSLRIPSFLVRKAEAAQDAAQAGPSSAGTTAMTGVPMDAQVGAMAVLRGAFKAITPTRQTGGSAGAPSRTTSPSVTVDEVAPGLTDASRTRAITDVAREVNARGMEPIRQPGRRAGEVRAHEGLAALMAANTASATATTADTTTANAPSTGATPVASARHPTAVGALTMLDPSGLTGLTSGPSAAPAEAGPADGLLDAQVGSEAWQDQLGAQLSVMATAGGETEAVMKLAPEELGELEIRVLIRDGEASLQFGAANAEARQAIEAAQPRLRELFASQGMGVSNFSVFSSLSGDPHSSSRQGEGAPRPPRGGAALREDIQIRVTSREAQGIVDLYA